MMTTNARSTGIMAFDTLSIPFSALLYTIIAVTSMKTRNTTQKKRMR